MPDSSPPTPGGSHTPPMRHDYLHVVPGEIRKVARTWSKEAGQLGHILSESRNLSLDHSDPGLFENVVRAYNNVVVTVTERAIQGQSAMANIAEALNQSAEVYERVEEENRNHASIKAV